VRNVHYSEFKIINKIGSSDHRALEIEINNTQALIVRKQMKQNSKLARQLLPEFREEIKLYVQDPQQAL
jgi:hypothetical protein